MSLIFCEVPVELQNACQAQGGGDTPAVFLSQQNGYVRFGEQEDAAGVMGEFFLFNQAAFDDIGGNLPTSP